MSHKPSHSTSLHFTSFAGAHGTIATWPEREDISLPTTPSARGMLLDSSGLWAVRLNALTSDHARTLLQVLRDLTPPGTQTDTPFIHRISAYDEAAVKDTTLAREIEDGIRHLDALSRRITGNTYLGLGERAMRRTVLSQMEEHPFFNRLGVHLPSYSKAGAM